MRASFIADGLLLMHVQTFSVSPAKAVQHVVALATIIAELDVRAVVVDIRGNGGGRVGSAYTLLSLFLPPDILVGYLVHGLGLDTAARVARARATEWDGSTVQIVDDVEKWRTLKDEVIPAKQRLLNTQVYILTDHETFSAAEIFLFEMMMRHPKCTVIGEQTRGGGRFVRIDMFMMPADEGHGFAVYYIMSPTGTYYSESIDMYNAMPWESSGIRPTYNVSGDSAMSMLLLLHETGNVHTI